MKLAIDVLVVGVSDQGILDNYVSNHHEIRFSLVDSIGLPPYSSRSIDLLVLHDVEDCVVGESTLSWPCPVVRVRVDHSEPIEYVGQAPKIEVMVQESYWLEHMLQVIRQLLAFHRYGIPLPKFEEHHSSLLGKSSAMDKLRSLICRFAPSSFPVLIHGESGTGKELVAKEIHKHSQNAKGPFVAINCGALTGSILESELFGSERGAFTGAEKTSGFLEAAAKGTLFMDEIGEIPLEHQVKLLRVLENGEYHRLGSRKTLRFSARIVAATNRNLREEVKGGRFRHDLFQRLNLASIQVPPLRERLEDIELLSRYFLDKEGYNKPLDLLVLDKLVNYPWPGNVRELKNVLCRAQLLSEPHDILPESMEFWW